MWFELRPQQKERSTRQSESQAQWDSLVGIVERVRAASENAAYAPSSGALRQQIEHIHQMGELLVAKANRLAELLAEEIAESRTEGT